MTTGAWIALAIFAAPQAILGAWTILEGWTNSKLSSVNSEEN